MTLAGRVEPLEEGAPGHGAAKSLYLARFPDAEMRFSLPDFVLFRFLPGAARYVGGFARAARLTGAQLVRRGPRASLTGPRLPEAAQDRVRMRRVPGPEDSCDV